MTITIYHDDDHARVICGKMADLSHYAEYDENESEKRTHLVTSIMLPTTMNVRGGKIGR